MVLVVNIYMGLFWFDAFIDPYGVSQFNIVEFELFVCWFNTVKFELLFDWINTYHKLNFSA